MALIVTNTMQTSINGTVGGHNFTNVFHTSWLGTNVDAPIDVAGDVFAAYRDTLLTTLCNSVALKSYNFVDLRTEDGDSGSVDISGSVVGGDGSLACSPAVCYLVSWQATGGRAQRNGRSYLPGVAETGVENTGVLTTTYQSDLQNQIDDFRDALQAVDLGLVIVSRTSPSSGVARTVLDGTIQAEVATQRRRQRR